MTKTPSVEEIEEIILSRFASWTIGEVNVNTIAKALHTKFSKPIKYPEKKDNTHEGSLYHQASNNGYNQAISDFKKMNGGGE